MSKSTTENGEIYLITQLVWGGWANDNHYKIRDLSLKKLDNRSAKRSTHSFKRSAKRVSLFFQCRSGSESAFQIFSNEWEWECHSKNKGVLNPLPTWVRCVWPNPSIFRKWFLNISIFGIRNYLKPGCFDKNTKKELRRMKSCSYHCEMK